MLFNSLPFLVFFPLFALTYFATRGRLRLLVCVSASYLFYGWWDWRFLGLIVLSTLVDFWVGTVLSKSDASPRSRRRLLGISLFVNLGILGLFKYFNFFVDSFIEFSSLFGFDVPRSSVSLLLPVGISFYTFQTLSYSIDVYRRKLEPERSLLCFATFVAFFPQLVAGPIVRASKFLPQLRIDHKFCSKRTLDGLGLVLWGFFKKVAVADSLAALVDGRFADPGVHSSLSLALGIFFYAFQIYCDFSGYSDIAIGLGRILGLELGKNFRTPYFAQSFSEFWRRWHISLSTWLRDYLYVSLGGNRGSRFQTYRNLFLTMLLGGLWHGASWNFVIWGALHGAYLAIERLVRGTKAGQRSGGLIGVVRTLWIFSLTSFAWIFFRAETLADSKTIIARIASLDGLSLSSVGQKFLVVRAVLLIAILLACELAATNETISKRVTTHPVGRIVLFSICLWLIAFFGTFDGSQFIYFQF